MQTSCGLIITNNKKILIVRNTGFNSWDLPKGRKEEGEQDIETCIREVYEEVGVDVSSYKDKFIDLGLFSYLKDKRLHLFMLILEELPSLENMNCSTYFTSKDGESLPEIDKYKYIEFSQINDFLRPKMIEVLDKIFISDFSVDKKSQMKFVMGFMLRHNAEYFNLNMNAKGYVKIETLFDRVKNFSVLFEDSSIEEILDIVETDDRNRFSILEDLIKANYGHSFKIDGDFEEVQPPDILYHGTNDFVIRKIVEEGLLPMNRNFVSLTSSKDMAKEYANRENRGYYRKKVWPVLLEVDAKSAWESGIKFHKHSENVFSSEKIPWNFIKRISIR